MSGRIGFVVCATIALAALATASPGTAQLEPYTPTGSRLARAPTVIDPKLARQMRKDFARCVYRRDKAQAELFLQTSDPSAVDYGLLGVDEDDFGEAFEMNECLGEAMTFDQLKASMAFTAPELRGMLAEEAYLEKHREPLSLAEESGEFLLGRFFVVSPSIARSKSIGYFADCVVFHAPAEADKVLRTTPASDEEHKAVVALVPAISSCLTQGDELEVTPESMRRIVADGLWARSHYGATIAGAAE